jgi:UDP-glucuronate 4-epimerase
MKILITGTAGFIGYHLINRLVGEDDVELLGIDNINSYYDPELKYNRLRQCGVEKNEIRPGSKVTSALLANYQFSQIELQDTKALSFDSGRFQTRYSRPSRRPGRGPLQH